MKYSGLPATYLLSISNEQAACGNQRCRYFSVSAAQVTRKTKQQQAATWPPVLGEFELLIRFEMDR